MPVPTVSVKEAIEAARAATTAKPRHERERNDAVPSVVRLLWGELLDAATQLAAAIRRSAPPVNVGYDPETYLAVFSKALSHRNWEPLPVEVALPPQDRSVYDVDAPIVDLAPSDAEAAGVRGPRGARVPGSRGAGARDRGVVASMSRTTSDFLMEVYRRLFDAYGPQRWWPGAETPIEVCIGAILTQSAAWTNVELALRRLRAADALSLNGIHAATHEEAGGARPRVRATST